jgi:hypothetical protein
MNHISNAPNEILIFILRELPREDWFNVCLVSRLFSERAQYLIYNQITLQSDQITLFLMGIASNPRLASCVQSAHISWDESRRQKSISWRKSHPILELSSDPTTPHMDRLSITSESEVSLPNDIAGSEIVNPTPLIRYAQRLGCTEEM